MIFCISFGKELFSFIVQGQIQDFDKEGGPGNCEVKRGTYARWCFSHFMHVSAPDY